jgi:DNA-binding NtrC family response regulator
VPNQNATNLSGTGQREDPSYKIRSLSEALEEPERNIILEVLRVNQWNRNATADQLGINRTTLYKKMRKLGIAIAEPS